MVFRELDDYIRWLETDGQLHRVREPVETRFGIARHEELHDGKRAVLFENVVGHQMPVVANIFNSRRNIATALGVEPGVAMHRRLMDAARNPIPTRLQSEAPSRAVKFIGAQVDLRTQLPNPMHFADDAGHYISSGVIVARDRETGKRNLSFARMLVKDSRTIVVMINFYRHLAELYRRAERRGEALEVAIVIGVDPLTWLEGAMPDRLVPLSVDELEVAGALRGEALPVVRCETVDLEVPASAQIVIEGVMPPGLRELEGPYGDYSRVYDGPPRQNPVIQVRAITHRESPIYLDCLPGSYDNWLLGGVCREADLLQHLQATMPNVKAVCLPEGACCRFHAVVQIRKEHEYDGMHAIVGTLGPTEASRDVKWVVVVDEDVDPFDPMRVQWAIATRTQWDRDLVMIPRMAMALDPSALARTPPALRKNGDVLSTKAGLDATIPLDPPELVASYRRAAPPPRN